MRRGDSHRNSLASAGVKLCSVAIFALVSVWPARGDTNQPTPQVHGICQFILHAYPLSKSDAAKINFVVADLVKRQSEAFGFETDTNLQIRIRMFGRYADYCQFGSTNHGTAGGESLGTGITNLAGYYSSGNNEVVTWRQKDPSYLANNILHECSHAISHSQYHVIPIWLNEGCAVYFSFPLFLRDASDTRKLNARWARMKKYLDEGALPGIAQFVNLNPAEFRTLPQDRAYVLSWSLFQLLMSKPENRKAMSEMMRRLQQTGTPPADCAKLLDEWYPGGVAKMEKDWREWIARGAANVLPTRPAATR
jgi:hypothetical protein